MFRYVRFLASLSNCLNCLLVIARAWPFATQFDQKSIVIRHRTVYGQKGRCRSIREHVVPAEVHCLGKLQCATVVYPNPNLVHAVDRNLLIQIVNAQDRRERSGWGISRDSRVSRRDSRTMVRNGSERTEVHTTPIRQYHPKLPVPVKPCHVAPSAVNGDHLRLFPGLSFLAELVVEGEAEEEQHGDEAVDDDEDDGHRSPPKPVVQGR